MSLTIQVLQDTLLGQGKLLCYRLQLLSKHRAPWLLFPAFHQARLAPTYNPGAQTPRVLSTGAGIAATLQRGYLGRSGSPSLTHRCIGSTLTWGTSETRPRRLSRVSGTASRLGPVCWCTRWFVAKAQATPTLRGRLEGLAGGPGQPGGPLPHPARARAPLTAAPGWSAARRSPGHLVPVPRPYVPTSRALRSGGGSGSSRNTAPHWALPIGREWRWPHMPRSQPGTAIPGKWGRHGTGDSPEPQTRPRHHSRGPIGDSSWHPMP